MKVIVIGAVAAGSKAASKLKRLQPDWEVVIYTADRNVAYSECGMPYYIAGAFQDATKLIIRTPEEFGKNGIKVYIQHEVIKINPESKSITVKNLISQDIFHTNYDKLIIATGANPVIPNIENVNLKNIFTLRAYEDGLAIKKAVLSSKRALILGAGYIGIELLEAFVKQGLSTAIIQSSPFIMSLFDDDMADLIQKYVLQRNLEQVKVVNNDTIIAFEGDKFVKKAITKSGKEIETDFVVLSIGVTPNVELAKNAGITLGTTGAIKVNPYLETNIKDIYACGDCVEKYHIVAQAPCWIPLGSTANKEGRCCAINVAGQQEAFEGVLGSAVTRYFDFSMSMTGLTEKMAKKYGYDPVSVIIRKNDKAGYMPNVGNIVIKLTADKKTKKILGAQGLGQGDVDKRINTLTSALLSKMTIKEFFGNDITYAPPFSTSIDPMLTAAKNLTQKLSLS